MYKPNGRVHSSHLPHFMVDDEKKNQNTIIMMESGQKEFDALKERYEQVHL